MFMTDLSLFTGKEGYTVIIEDRHGLRTTKRGGKEFTNLI